MTESPTFWLVVAVLAAIVAFWLALQVVGFLLKLILLVVAVLFLFLGNLRAATIVALAIPLSMMFAFSGMLRFGIAASLLSLGALDFGMIVDSSVVMVENCVRHLADNTGNSSKSRLQIIREAAVEDLLALAEDEFELVLAQRRRLAAVFATPLSRGLDRLEGRVGDEAVV